jgi:glyoxylase-like metal-dependent hydrolase (beta-lactamase superfamily II)
MLFHGIMEVIVKVIILTYKATNCYLLPAGEGWLMIDAGWPDTFCQLLQLLNQNNISVNEINYLFVTHYHPDHAGLVQNLKDLGTNLVLHEEQIPFVSKLNLFYKKNPKANFKDILSTNTIVLTDDNSRNFFESIGINGELITTPGHTDDSVSLVIEEDCAFIGDLPAISLVEAYDDLVIEDSWDMLQKHHIKTIYPGHGQPYDI